MFLEISLEGKGFGTSEFSRIFLKRKDFEI